MNGRIRAIQTSPGSGEPMVSHAEIVATPGRGLEGDRYSLGRGAWVKEIKPGDHELTLIETEQLEWFRRETGQELTHRMSRRNILTQGVELNALVGSRFHIGEIEVEGEGEVVCDLADGKEVATGDVVVRECRAESAIGEMKHE